MKLTIRIQDVEIIYEDKHKEVSNSHLVYDIDGGKVLKAIKSITDDCIRAFEATKQS
ncbi:MAG: ribosomal protein S8 [Enterobacterales bacterium]|jgi:ribosomal protein S8